MAYDRGSKESYQEVAGNLLMEEQKVRMFSKAKKKKDQVGAGWLRLGDPERFTGHLQTPSIYGRSQPSWKLQGICLEAQYCLILTGFQNQERIHHHPGASAVLAPETCFQLFLFNRQGWVVRRYLISNNNSNTLCYSPRSTRGMLIHLFSKHFYVSDGIDIIHILPTREKILRLKRLWQDLNLTSG